MAFDVFISHAHADKAWALALKAALKKRNLSVWIDHHDLRAGDQFVEGLQTAIEQSRSVAIVVSPESLSSSWVKEEWHFALRRSHDVGDFRLIPCLLKGRSVPGFLGNFARVDFRDPDTFEHGVDEVFRAITGRELEAPVPELTVSDDPATVSAKLAFLETLIQRKKAERRGTAFICGAAPIVGLLGSIVYPPVEGFPLATHYFGPAVVTGLIGIAATSGKWLRLGAEMNDSMLLRAAIALCEADRRPECSDVDRRLGEFVKTCARIGRRRIARPNDDT